MSAAMTRESVGGQVTDVPMMSKELPNSVFIPALLKLMNEGHTITIPARGNSMMPFVEDGTTQLVFGKTNMFRVSDVVLAEVQQGVFVCHRIVSIDDGIVTMRGDGNIVGTETFPLDRVRAKLLAVIRGGKTYWLATSCTWKFYSVLWPQHPLLRRILLALYRLLWMHKLPERWRRI